MSSAQQQQQLVQGMRWLKQKLTSMGGAARLLGIDIGRMALDGKVLFGIRVYAKPEGRTWLQQYGFPGLIETPYGTFYAAVLGPESLPQQRPSQPTPPGQQPQPRPQPQAQPPSQYPGAPKPPGQADGEDPYAGWDVEYSGTDLEHADVKHFGSKVEEMRVEVHGTKGVKPKAQESGEFRIKSGCFGTTFSQFEPED
jgi:hypothetical protein